MGAGKASVGLEESNERHFELIVKHKKPARLSGALLIEILNLV